MTNKITHDENGNPVREESFGRTTDLRKDEKQETKLSEGTKDLLAIELFLLIFLLAMANTKQNNLVIHLWIVVVSIVCPLMSHFIPSIFYYKVSKGLEDDDPEGKKERQCKRVMSIMYCVIGAFFLPLFLTLATKALFTSATTE